MNIEHVPSGAPPPYWHPIDHPHCPTCNGLAKAVRPRRKTFVDDGVICQPQGLQLSLNASLTFRKHLRQLIRDSRLPHTVFAQLIKVSTATLAEWLTTKMPTGKQLQYLRDIQHIHRDGNSVCVTHLISQLSARWDKSLRQREMRTSEHLLLQAQALSVYKSIAIPIYNAPRRRRGRKR